MKSRSTFDRLRMRVGCSVTARALIRLAVLTRACRRASAAWVRFSRWARTTRSWAAPRCYGMVKRPDGSIWLWLEEIRDRFAAVWPLERYTVAARDIGAFNGAYLVGRPVPDHPWLSKGWLRG